MITIDDLEIGDYVQISMCEGYFRVTSVDDNDNSFDAVDKFGTPYTMLSPDDVVDFKLESEITE